MTTLAAYCARAWRVSTLITVRRRPLTSPPLTAAELDLQALKAGVVYLRLHGIADQPYLYGDPGWPTALTAKQVRGAPEVFAGALVFLEGCFGGMMAGAFLDAGARAVVGSDRVTYGRRLRRGPSSQIGSEWLKGIKHGETAKTALAGALAKVPSRFSDGWEIAGDKGAKLS